MLPIRCIHPAWRNAEVSHCTGSRCLKSSIHGCIAFRSLLVHTTWTSTLITISAIVPYGTVLVSCSARKGISMMFGT